MTGAVFDRIYRDNLWNGEESRSGPGSGDAATRHLRYLLPKLVAEIEAEYVWDIGCGDGYWMPDLPGYLGIDASRVAIRQAMQNHPDRRYAYRLPTRVTPDLFIVRDVFQHLSLRDGLALLGELKKRPGAWLLASTFVGGENVNIQTGDAYSPDLTAPPFTLGTPDQLIFDGFGYEDADAIRDARKHLGLWRL